MPGRGLDSETLARRREQLTGQGACDPFARNVETNGTLSSSGKLDIALSREKAELDNESPKGKPAYKPEGEDSKNMGQPTTRFTNMLLGISVSGAAVLMCWAGISGADVRIFHVLYISLVVLLALMCISTNIRGVLVVTSLSVVLVALWTFVNASYTQPVLYDSDLNTELRIVQHLLLDNHLPQLIGGAKSTYYATYPGLELLATSLYLVSGVAAIDFLGYGAAVLSGITVWLIFAFYRRLLPQRSLATKATMVAAFSCYMITFGALAIHETLALVFVCLALVGLSLPRRSSLAGTILFCLAGIATIISNIFTAFLFVILSGVYVLCSWILMRRLDKDTQIFRIRHLYLYAMIFLAWNVWVSSLPTMIGLHSVQSVLGFSANEYVKSALIPTGTKPEWVLTLILLGFVSYGLVTLAGFFATIRSQLSRLAKLIPFALSGGTIFVILFFLPIAGLNRVGGEGIQSRAFLYAYLFGAPLFIIGLFFVSTRKPYTLRYLFRARIVPLLILAIVLSPAVYYGLDSFLYDRTSPVTGLDIRLGYAGEHGAYVFASRYSATPQVLAVDIAARMGADTGTGVTIESLTDLIPFRYHSIGDLVRGQCRTMILRQSIARFPDSGYKVTTSEYQYLLAVSNIVYSSGDPLVLYVTYCA
jgi:hypothetical protein